MKTSTLLILAILSILLLTASSSASTSSTTSLQSFIQCFQENTKASLNQLLHTSNSTSYEPILESSAQNLRFIASNTNQKPSVIVTATSESHISETVRCAYRHGLQLRTRSGGHDYEGMSYVTDDKELPFVLLDLALFRSVVVDAKHRTVWVQAGATLGELYYTIFTKTNGTAGFPAGVCTTLGVGGHISVGGIGAMTRKYGVAADHVIDAKVVGIDGQVSNGSEMGNDLFWAIRGGGASFGIIAAYKLQLVDVPPVVTAFSIERNLRQNATKLVTRWQVTAPNMDENILMRAIPQASTENETISILFRGVFLGNRSQFLSEMEKSFPELGLKEEDCNEMNWLESILFMNGMSGQGVEALLDRTRAYNSSFKGKSDFVTKPITEAQWEKIWTALLDLKAKGVNLMMIMEPFGGQMDKIPESAIPFPHRKGNLYNIQYYSSWSGADEKENQKQTDSMREFYDIMAPYVSSNPRTAYYGFKDIDFGTTDIYSKAREWGEKYFKSNFARLAVVKGRVDPTNFFRNEQSIPPLYSSIRSGITSTTFQE